MDEIDVNKAIEKARLFGFWGWKRPGDAVSRIGF